MPQEQAPRFQRSCSLTTYGFKVNSSIFRARSFFITFPGKMFDIAPNVLSEAPEIPCANLRTVCMKKADSQASGEIKPEPPAAIEERDPGVSDEIWAELQHAKKVHCFCELGHFELVLWVHLNLGLSENRVYSQL